MNTRQNFSRAAAAYDVNADFQHTQTQRLFDYAQTRLTNDRSILDIGCGTGNFARLSPPAWRITGMDSAVGMAVQAAQHMECVVVGDALSLPFADAAFDAVVSSLCLQWVDDLARAFNEISRVLKPCGRAILITLAGDTLREIRESSAALNIPLSLLPMRDSASYLNAAQKAGLQLQFQDSPIITQHYADSRALLNSMRRIGAGYRQTARSTPKQMKAVLTHYDTHYREGDGVKASWQPLLMEVIKPA